LDAGARDRFGVPAAGVRRSRRHDPHYEETTAFLKDTDPKKREKLVDKLLADPRYA